jgi:hypothetical protein
MRKLNLEPKWFQIIIDTIRSIDVLGKKESGRD